MLQHQTAPQIRRGKWLGFHQVTVWSQAIASEFGMHSQRSLCVHPAKQIELSAFPFQRFQTAFMHIGTEHGGRHKEVTPMGLMSPAAETRKPDLCLQMKAATGRNAPFYIRKLQTLLEAELRDHYHVIFCKIYRKSYMTAEAIIIKILSAISFYLPNLRSLQIWWPGMQRGLIIIFVF